MIVIVVIITLLAVIIFLVAMFFNFKELEDNSSYDEKNQMDIDILSSKIATKILSELKVTDEGQEAIMENKKSPIDFLNTKETSNQSNVIDFDSRMESMRNVGNGC